MYFVSEKIRKETAAVELIKNDVVIATVGSWPKNPASIVGKTIRVPSEASGSLLNQNAVRLRVKSLDFFDQVFLYYLLKDQNFSDYIVSTAQGSANQASITLKDIYRYSFQCPTLDERKIIAQTLNSLDNKIELNRQTNQTLEEMAQALFTSWFMDFDPVIDNALAAGNPIPDELQERAQRRQQQLAKPDHKPLPDDILQLFPSEFELTEELGWLPKGWESAKVKDFGRVVTGKTPPKSVTNAYSAAGYPFITPTDIDDSAFVVNVNRCLSESGALAVHRNKIPAGSVCVTCIGSQMGKTTINPIEANTNQQINTVVVKDDACRNFLFFNLRRRREELFSLGASGSTMPILNKTSFENILVLKPSNKILQKYAELTANQVGGIYQRYKQIDSLEKTRDALLPKLISGELRLSSESSR